MIIVDQIEQKPTLSSSITETNQFSIKNSAKAFYILSTSLYSNPILAILRELGCNARDSHVEAGQTKPWRLHLPTIINPMLEIEDYGVGLSHDQVMNLFTTFFESTKTGSNDFVGALGLGSKSPFSYTDNFTITSVKNGTRNVYSAYKTDAGVPAIARMHTESTDANNGVLIQIAVKTSDFNTFESNARAAFQFFDQLPSCNKTLNKANLKEFAPFGEDLGIKHQVGYGNKSVVVMGGIGYPIDTMRKEFTEYSNILSHCIVLPANIGDVEMTPSREGLTYNKQTVDWIVSKLEVIAKKIELELEKKTSAYTSNWEKAKFLISQKDNALYKSLVSRLIASHFPNGLPAISFREEELKNVGVKLTRFVSKDSYSKKKPVDQSGSIHWSVDSYAARTTEITFLFDDSKVRVMDMLASRIPGNLYLFQVTDSNNVKKAEAFIKSRLAETCHELDYTSKKIHRVQTEKKAKTDYYKFTYKETGGYYSRRTVMIAQRESGSIPAKAKFWVQLTNGSISARAEYPSSASIGGSMFSVDDVKAFVNSNKDIVVGFSKTSKVDTSDLVNVYDHLDTEYQKELVRANTPDGLMQLVIECWAKNTYTSLPTFDDQTLELLEDKLLVKMIKIKRDKPESFKFANMFRSRVAIFNVLYRQVDGHFSETYSMLNLSADASTKKKIAAMNFLYNYK